MKILSVVGARPNFIKIVPIIEELNRYPQIRHYLVHTGQHYDDKLSRMFLRSLKIKDPDINLGVGSGTHAEQTAGIMLKFEDVLLKKNPDLVLVTGDVNSTLACSLVASKMSIPIAHVEAGMRNFDKTMPEEINRVITDLLSDYLFTTCKDANDNLKREGIPGKKIFFVGNVMIDSLFRVKNRMRLCKFFKKVGLNRKDYAVFTLHRPSNVDDEHTLRQIVNALRIISRSIKIVFPVHPRTKKQLCKFGMEKYFYNRGFLLLEPLGYLNFLNLLYNSKFVLTDSGGIQEETTVLGIPCLTLRNNTERPITVEMGTNRLVGTSEKRIIKESSAILNGSPISYKVPKYWDGKSAKRIVNILLNVQ